MKQKQSVITKEGEVVDVNRGNYRVILNESGIELVCKKGGKLDHFNINILIGDQVRVEISPYDLTRGRIVRRLDANGKDRVSDTFNQRKTKNMKQDAKKLKKLKRREEKKLKKQE